MKSQLNSDDRSQKSEDGGEGILPLFLYAGKMPAGRKEWRGHPLGSARDRPGLVLDARAGRPRHTASPQRLVAGLELFVNLQQAGPPDCF